MVYHNRYIFENAEPDEEDIPFELEDEASFRQYIIFQLLLSKGFKYYANELKNFYVNFTDDPRRTAAVDAENKIVIINREVAEKLLSSVGQEKREAEAKLSMLIRHELLHAILNHRKRTIIYIAKKLGYDPFAMTKEQFEKVEEVYCKPSILYRNYNGGAGIKRSNGAGDLDLSRYYIEKDVDLTKNMGGLLLEDHPNWANYSFEEILAALEEQERQLNLRLKNIVYGSFDANGEFIVDHEDESWFATATEIDPQDIRNIRIMIPEEAQEADKIMGSGQTWVDTKTSDPTKTAGYYANNGILEITYANAQRVIPILEIDNLDLYKAIADQFSQSNFAAFRCFGMRIYILDTGLVLIPDLLPEYVPFDDKSGLFKGSKLQLELKSRLQEEIKKAKQV